MPSERQERRLAAILATDMVAYSRFMEADETGTLAALNERRREIIDPAITDHRGRIVKTTGDGLLVEFASVVDAVGCAVSFQRAMAARNDGIPEDQQIRFRVGINLGDIIVEGNDIFGEGVNIAARIESLAEPGGVSVSAAVHQQLKSKIDIEYEDQGLQSVKNIEEPIHIYKLLLEPQNKEVEAAVTPSVGIRPMPAVAFAVVLVFCLSAGALWWNYGAPDPEPAGPDDSILSATDDRTIAVLPFQNLSNDEAHDYFADGIAEDIITDLSKIAGLFVIARNTSFQYRDGSEDLVQVGRDLGVRYILEGSVRRAGDQVRINAQLIDASTGGHVWAERYDGTMDNVFAAQDRVTDLIIGALRVQLTPSEQKAIDEHGTDKPDAYDAYLRGLRLISDRRRLDVEANDAAQAAFMEAVRIDPEYALAYAGLAWAKWLYIETVSEQFPYQEIADLAERSISITDNALAHRALAKQYFAPMGFWSTSTSQPELAVLELESARKLQPNDPDVLADLAMGLPFVGRPEEAITLLQRARELNPNHPTWYFAPLGIALLLNGEAERAVEHLRIWTEANEHWQTPYIFLASALGNAGDIAAAQVALDKYHDMWGYVSTLRAVRTHWVMDADEEEIFMNGLRLAGMQETVIQEEIK